MIVFDDFFDQFDGLFDGASEATPDARAIFLVEIAEGDEAGLGGESETFVRGGHAQRVTQGPIKSKNCFALSKKKNEESL